MSAVSQDQVPSAVAIVVARDGRLPIGATEAVAEAGGRVVVVGSGAADATRDLPGVVHAWWRETGPGFRPGELAHALAPLVGPETLVVLPASPDGRDLAPRLAAAMGRPLLARVLTANVRLDKDGTPGVHASVARVDDHVLVPIDVGGPAVVTLIGGTRGAQSGAHGGEQGGEQGGAHGGAHESISSRGAIIEELVSFGNGSTSQFAPDVLDPDLVELLAPDLHTMDLVDATRVLAGGAGLVTGLDDQRATSRFSVLVHVAAALGGSAGATRVATDAGWTGYERQIGTTGVTVDPDLYVAFGVSGAAQHTGGLGNPRHIVSINTDPSCPMTARADLGLVADAGDLVAELARRVGVDVAGDASTGSPALESPSGTSEGNHA